MNQQNYYSSNNVQGPKHGAFVTLMIGAIISVVVATGLTLWILLGSLLSAVNEPSKVTLVGILVAVLVFGVWFITALILNAILIAKARVGLRTDETTTGLLVLCFITAIISVNIVTFVAAIMLASNAASQTLPNQSFNQGQYSPGFQENQNRQNPNNSNGNVNNQANNNKASANAKQNQQENQILQQDPNNFQPK